MLYGYYQKAHPAGGFGSIATGWLDRPWPVIPAKFDADFANARFALDGQTYADEAAWLAAIGGIQAGNARIIGPYIDPAAPELIVNGDFADGTDSWQTGGGASIDVVDGQCVLSGNGANSPNVMQSIAPLAGTGRAYSFFGRYARGTQNNSVTIGVMNSSGGSPNSYSQSVAAADTTLIEATIYCGGIPDNGFFGGKSYGNPMNGTAIFDDFSAREALPYAGFAPGALSGIIEATTPAAAAEQVLFQADDNASDLGNALERNFIRLVWDGAQHLRLIVSSGASGAAVEAANLDLGIVPVSTPFKVAFSAKGGRHAAALEGGASALGVSNTFPGVCAMRIGKPRSDSVGLWQGSIERATVWAGEKLPAAVIRTEGDSYMGGAGGVDLPNTLAALMGRAVLNTGVGGSEMGGVRDRMLDPANAALLAQPTIFWDGSPNGLTTAVAYADLLQNAIGALGHERFIVIPSAAPYGISASALKTALNVQAEFQARWPENFLDWRDWIANTDGIINQDRMLNYPADGWHLNQIAMDEMAAGIAAFIAAKGW